MTDRENMKKALEISALKQFRCVEDNQLDWASLMCNSLILLAENLRHYKIALIVRLNFGGNPLI